MPIREKHHRVVRKLPFRLSKLKSLLEWLLATGIFCSFLTFFFHSGGSLAIPEAVAVNSVVISATCVVFGLWWLACETPKSLSSIGFVFLPWLTYLAFGTFARPGSQAQSLVNLGMWMQAAAVMAIVATVGRSRTFVFKLIAAIFIFALLCAFAGIRQYGFSPGWAPGGFRQAAWVSGVACGPFARPSSLAALMVLVLPLAYGIAAAKAFGNEIKIVCWVLTFIFTSCLILTANIPAIAITAVVFVAMPFMHSKSRAKNFRDICVAFAIAVLAFALVGMTDHESRSKMIDIFNRRDPAPRSFMNETAVSAFGSHIIAGAGDEYLALQMKGAQPQSENPDAGDYNGQYLQSLASSGLFSILLFAPLALCLVAGWGKWNSLPFHKVSQDEEFRNMPHDIGGANSSPNQRHHRRRHRSSSNDSHPMPTTKVLLGGFLVGLGGFCAIMIFSSPLRSEALVFVMAASMAAIFSLGRFQRIDISHSLAGISGLGLAAIWAGITISASLTSSYSQMHIFRANERMYSLNEKTSPLKNILRAHFDSIEDLDMALTLEPRNYDAVAYMAKLEFSLAKYLSSQSKTLNQHALSSLDAAIDANPDNWYYKSIMADALCANFNNMAKADEAYDALAIAGRRSPYALSLCATYFGRREGMEKKALQLSEAALKMIPNYEAAENVKAMISLKTNL